jgi:uncharacterized protein DUF3800
MPRQLFRVYVDEAGDRGWGGRSTPTFVLSAVIVPDEEADDLRTMLTDINDALGKPPKTVLHWAENVKQHSQRKFVARTIGASSATVTNVIVLKEPMLGSGTRLSDASSMYNYAIRRLLERVSWYVDEHNGEAIVTFAHVRRFPYEKLRAYVKVLRRQPTEIRWKVLRTPFRIDQPLRVRPLQVADLAAGCLNSALKADDYGDFEPAYFMELVPRIYLRGSGHVASYGMNIVGPRNNAKEYMAKHYPWWDDFAAACATKRIKAKA